MSFLCLSISPILTIRSIHKNAVVSTIVKIKDVVYL
jgi:hypothetical protein